MRAAVEAGIGGTLPLFRAETARCLHSPHISWDEDPADERCATAEATVCKLHHPPTALSFGSLHRSTRPSRDAPAGGATGWLTERHRKALYSETRWKDRQRAGTHKFPLFAASYQHASIVEDPSLLPARPNSESRPISPP